MTELGVKIVIFLAICGLIYVAIQAFGIPIPGWAYTAFGIVVVAVCLIYAMRFIGSQKGPPQA